MRLLKGLHLTKLANDLENRLQSLKIILLKFDPYSYLTTYSLVITSLVFELGKTDSRQIKGVQPHQ